MTDNIIPFNPNPDFGPLTEAERKIYEAGGLSDEIVEFHQPQEGPDKELCSLFIFKLPNNEFVGFVSLSENICDKEDFFDQMETIREAYKNSIYDNQEDCIALLSFKYEGMFSSIVIFC